VKGKKMKKKTNEFTCKRCGGRTRGRGGGKRGRNQSQGQNEGAVDGGQIGCVRTSINLKEGGGYGGGLCLGL